MIAAFGCLVSLWIASHVVQTHGDETQIHPPSTAPHLRRQMQENSDPNYFLFFLYLSVYVLDFFDDKQVELRKLRRGRRLCRLFLPSNCICRENQLVRTIRQNRKAEICYGATIKMNREIDITGKRFTITCARPTGNKRGSCKILGSGSHRLFNGAPANAILREIDMENGSASEGGIAMLTGGRARFDGCVMSHSKATVNGGAIRISGGTHDIDCTFRNNSAAGDGGAISASGSSTSVALLGGSMAFNNATNGGALSAVNGARVAITSNNSLCSFSDNIATVNGGAIYLRNTTVNLQMGMSDNTAGSQGGALYLKNARVSLEWITLGIPLFYALSKDIWIDDDDDPSDGGSFVSCIATNGPLDLKEIAAGPNQTQRFQNSNCPRIVRRPQFTAFPVNPASGAFPAQPVQPPMVSPPS
jgi:predicted outer membrane repeat protein